MCIAYPEIILACQKQAVSYKPTCKVQTFLISPLPQISPPSNKPPCPILEFDNKPPVAKSRLYGNVCSKWIMKLNFGQVIKEYAIKGGYVIFWYFV